MMKKKGNSAIAIGHNQDLINLILLRLPAKSLVRFKTVSKQWLSIISSRRFRQIHAASVSESDATALIFNKDKALKFVSLDNHTCPMTNSDQPMEILSSSGGLLLLRSRDYYICNPTTNEIKPLAAAIPQVIKESTSMVACLAFDPCKSLHYKILFVYTLVKFSSYFSIFHSSKVSMIYSSETRTFRSLEAKNIDLPSKGIYWNDAIHWISDRSDRCLNYFDLSKECTNVHQLPSSDFGHATSIGEYRGHLVVVTLDDYYFRVYESKRDYSSWSLKYKVDLASLGMPFPHTSTPSEDFRFLVFGVLADEEQDLSVVILLLRDYTFVACNLKKKLCNLLRTSGHPSNRHFVYQYKETLAWV